MKRTYDIYFSFLCIFFHITFAITKSPRRLDLTISQGLWNKTLGFFGYCQNKSSNERGTFWNKRAATSVNINEREALRFSIVISYHKRLPCIQTHQILFPFTKKDLEKQLQKMKNRRSYIRSTTNKFHIILQNTS